MRIQFFFSLVLPVKGFTYPSHICNFPGAALAWFKISQIVEVTASVHTLLFLLEQHERLCIHFMTTPAQQRSLKPIFWIEYKCVVRSK